MKKIIFLITICLNTVNCFSQIEKDTLYFQDTNIANTENIDSLYENYLKIKENDQRYEEALIFRNQYGWHLNRLEQLKKDIPAVLHLSKFNKEMAYIELFNPQMFPPSEWIKYYEMSIELEKEFDPKSNEYRELIGLKTMLEFITWNNNALKVDLPKLLLILNKDSDNYSMMLWQYGNLLIRTDNENEALNIFENGWKQTSESKFLQSMIQIYSIKKEYENIIKYEEEISKDLSGILFFDLADSYLQKNDTINAEKYFKKYTKTFKFVNYDPYIEIEYDNVIYTVSPFQLETLGDYYIKKDKVLSCKYYITAIKTLKSTNEEMLFNEEIIGIYDDIQKEKMISEHEAQIAKQKKLLERLENKTKECN